MLAPAGLSQMQHIACGFELRDIRRLVRGVRDDQRDIYDRLGSEAGNRCGPDVMYFNCPRAQRSPDALLFLLELRYPRGVVFGEPDRAIDANLRSQVLGLRSVDHALLTTPGQI